MIRTLVSTALIVASTLGLTLLVWGISVSLRAEGTGFGKKSLYDWLDLLIIPVVLVIGGWLLNRAERRAQNQIAEKGGKPIARLHWIVVLKKCSKRILTE